MSNREMRSDELVEAMENLHQYPRLIAERAYAEGLAAGTITRAPTPPDALREAAQEVIRQADDGYGIGPFALDDLRAALAHSPTRRDARTPGRARRRVRT